MLIRIVLPSVGFSIGGGRLCLVATGGGVGTTTAAAATIATGRTGRG